MDAVNCVRAWHANNIFRGILVGKQKLHVEHQLVKVAASHNSGRNPNSSCRTVNSSYTITKPHVNSSTPSEGACTTAAGCLQNLHPLSASTKHRICLSARHPAEPRPRRGRSHKTGKRSAARLMAGVLSRAVEAIIEHQKRHPLKRECLLTPFTLSAVYSTRGCLVRKRSSNMEQNRRTIGQSASC